MLSKRGWLFVAVLALLSAACVAVVLRDRGSYDTTRRVALAVDTAQVDYLCIGVADGGATIKLCKPSNHWLAITSSDSVAVADAVVGELLAAISVVEAERLMTNSESQWSQYGVGTAGGSRVFARGNGRVLADFYCGNVDFDASTRQLWTYVRNDSESAVYKTDGYLNLAITRCVEVCKKLMQD